MPSLGNRSARQWGRTSAAAKAGARAVLDEATKHAQIGYRGCPVSGRNLMPSFETLAPVLKALRDCKPVLVVVAHGSQCGSIRASAPSCPDVDVTSSGGTVGGVTSARRSSLLGLPGVGRRAASGHVTRHTIEARAFGIEAAGHTELEVT